MQRHTECLSQAVARTLAYAEGWMCPVYCEKHFKMLRAECPWHISWRHYRYQHNSARAACEQDSLRCVASSPPTDVCEPVTALAVVQLQDVLGQWLGCLLHAVQSPPPWQLHSPAAGYAALGQPSRHPPAAHAALVQSCAPNTQQYKSQHKHRSRIGLWHL